VSTEQPLALADELMDGMSDEYWNQAKADAAKELRRLHSENEALRAALSAPRHGEWERLLELKAELEREKSSRKAAQEETIDLKERIARADVELQRAVLAEREACAKVCTELVPTLTGHMCAAAIRARSKPQGGQT
jgi:hypothetical protein